MGAVLVALLRSMMALSQASDSCSVTLASRRSEWLVPHEAGARMTSAAIRVDAEGCVPSVSGG
jgi:hypothetical protein